MMCAKYYISVVCMLLLAVAGLAQDQEFYTAGDDIVLRFRESDKDAILFIQASLGSTLLKGKQEAGELTFEIPKIYSEQKGKLSYRLIKNGKTKHTGSIKIEADTAKTKVIEAYLGPSSITAGGEDFTQLTAIPVDQFDNRFPDSTLVKVSDQFKETVNQNEFRTHKGFVFEDIFSPLQDGTIMVVASSNDVAAEGMFTKVYPHLPTDFMIFAERPNNFADGDQITTLFTSTILDRYGNTVSDGSLVEFFITDDHGEVYRTTGATIHGVAKTQINHPEKPVTLTVKAGVDGIAESDTMSIQYFSAVEDFEFKVDDRTIIVGPVYSFLKQRIAEGTTVGLIVSNDNESHDFIKHAENGMVTFSLPAEEIPAGKWQIKLTVLGKEKSKMINIAQ